MNLYYHLLSKREDEKENSIGYIAAEKALERFQLKALESLKENNI